MSGRCAVPLTASVPVLRGAGHNVADWEPTPKDVLWLSTRAA